MTMVIISMHRENLEKVIANPNGYNLQHLCTLLTLTWFKDDSQPDFATLFITTIILAYTASMHHCSIKRC